MTTELRGKNIVPITKKEPLINSKVIIAFIGGMASIIGAYFAARAHLDKNICGITTEKVFSLSIKQNSYFRETNEKLNILWTKVGELQTSQIQLAGILTSIVIKRQAEFRAKTDQLPSDLDPILSRSDIQDIINPLHFDNNIELPEVKNQAILDKAIGDMIAVCPK